MLRKRHHMVEYRVIGILFLLVLIVLSIFMNIGLILDRELYQAKLAILLSIIWTSIIVVYFFVPKINANVKYNKKDQMYFETIVSALLLVGIRLIVGFLFREIGKSPYDLTFKGICLNSFIQGIPIVGREIIRAYFLLAFCKKDKWYIWIGIILIMTLTDINWSAIALINSTEKAVIFLAKQVGPSLSLNILLSCIAWYMGVSGCLIFQSILFIFQWVFPVLPNLSWITEAAIGILVPILITTYIVEKYGEKKKVEASRGKVEFFQWTTLLLLSIGFLWFVVGVFPIYPTVIVTGSMEPVIQPGDVVLIKRFGNKDQIDKLKIGDIIAFKRGDIIITHRILSIYVDEEGNIRYETKGDNNSSADIQLVEVSQLKGKYIALVPKIGYPTIWLKSNWVEQPEDVVN